MQQESTNKRGSGLAKYERQALLTIWYLVLAVLSIRGIGGYWGDLKDHIVSSELGKKSVVVKVDEKIDKYKEIKAKVFKEKGILLTDEDIKKYGFDK
jgi:hypothetical protein